MKTKRVPVAVGVSLLFVLPLLLPQSLVNASIQVLIAALFALAFNLLCGQGGMLSFGHAAFFGAGAFGTVHAMSAVGGMGLMPTPLLPLAGAVMGLACGGVAGWFATKRTGVYFAMITLALAELLHSLAPHLEGVFGGEAGVSAMRMPSMGLTFGTTAHVYYLVLIWVLVSAALLYFYTQTPVGRLTIGLRENTNRLRFLGYDVHRVSVLAFAVSAMFSGIAGGLQVLNNEAANYVVFDAQLSAAVVINSYIGGVKVFLGPALGAALMTFFSYTVSDLTRSWLLYQGIVFVLVMMFAPAGLAGMFTWWNVNRRSPRAAAVLPVMALSIVAFALLAAGTVFTVELLQRLFSQDYRALASLNAAATRWPSVALLGRDWTPASLITWVIPAVTLGSGALAARAARARWLAGKDLPADHHTTADDINGLKR
jgi:branched-chain amino acid transport system permease protein